MGHLRLGQLPKTKRWRQVIEVLKDDDATSQDVAQATLFAIETGLRKAAQDEGLVTAFWLLARMADASTKPDFARQLRDIGINVPDHPLCFDITSAFSSYFNDLPTRVKQQSDVSEMAVSAATECIIQMCSVESRDLFGITPDDVRKSISRLATRTNFSKLGHEFFARFISRYVGYMLSRESSNHVGVSKRFQDIGGHSEFNESLDLYCRQATRIIHDFAGGWFSKKVYEGDLNLDKTAGFIHVAMKKLRSEFKRGEDIGQK